MWASKYQFLTVQRGRSVRQFIQPSQFVAIEIQAESCTALAHNYPRAKFTIGKLFSVPNGKQAEMRLCSNEPAFHSNLRI